MKLFFVLFVFLTSLALFAYGAQNQNQIPLADQALQFVWAKTNRATRLLLFSHFPGLFPVDFICVLKRPNAPEEAAFPNDTLSNNPEGTALNCPPGVEILMFPRSSFRIVKSKSGAPSIFLLDGGIELSVGNHLVDMGSASFDFEIPADKAIKGKIFFHINEERYGVICTEGETKVIAKQFFESRVLKSFFLAQGCKMAVERPKSNKEPVFLFHNDLVEVPNLSLSRNIWPAGLQAEALKSSGLKENTKNRINLSSSMSTPEGNLNLFWGHELLKPSCSLYVQKTERDTPSLAHSFLAENNAGQLSLQNAYKKLWIYMICTKEGQMAVSNLLSPHP